MLRIALITLALAAACSSKKKSGGGTGSGSAIAGSATSGSAAGGSGAGSAAAPVVPQPPIVVLRANDLNVVNVVRGQPLLLTLKLAHPDPTAPSVAPMIIGSAGAAWTDAVRIEILDAKKGKQTWPLHALVDRAEATLRLDGKQSGRLVWRLSADEVSAIAPGSYRIVATLDTTGAKSAGVWLGTRTSTAN